MSHIKLVILLRYIAITLMVASMILRQENTIDAIGVILVLSFLINGQVRLFYFFSKQVAVMGSFLLELVILLICYKVYGGYLVFYYLPTAIDVGYLLKKPQNYCIYLGIGLSMVWLEMVNSGMLTMDAIIITGGVLSIIIMLNEYIRLENLEKVKAQQVYDQLRISEEKLKKANMDLEEYATSIEEMTLLKERNRISRDIHDSVGHGLSTIIIQLGAIEKLAKKESNSHIESLSENLRNFAKNSLEEVRRAVRELKPKDYENYESILGIEELIKNFIKISGVDVRLKISQETWKLKSEQVTVVYRVVQEFLSNALRHGKASRVDFFMNYRIDALVLVLKDNGIGAESINFGVGLTGLYERVMEIGGTVEYNSSPAQGFMLKTVIQRSKAY